MFVSLLNKKACVMNSIGTAPCCTPVQTLTHAERSKLSKMAQFIGDSSSSSSDSSDSSGSDSESEPELNSLGFDVVSSKPVKPNEAGPGAQNSNIEKDREDSEKDSERGSKEKQKDRKTNKKARKANSAKKSKRKTNSGKDCSSGEENNSKE